MGDGAIDHIPDAVQRETLLRRAGTRATAKPELQTPDQLRSTPQDATCCAASGERLTRLGRTDNA
jgi:hypothetical protein